MNLRVKAMTVLLGVYVSEALRTVSDVWFNHGIPRYLVRPEGHACLGRLLAAAPGPAP